MLQFRSLQEQDLPLLHDWLNRQHIKQTFSGPLGMTYENVRQKYIPRILGEDPARPYLICADDVPIGYIQTYLWRDYPAYSSELQLEQVTAGLDLFIGEEAYLDRGLGAELIRSFALQVIFADREVESCVITPLISNRRALRAYSKAGFRQLATMHHPEEPEQIAVMKLARHDLIATM